MAAASIKRAWLLCSACIPHASTGRGGPLSSAALAPGAPATEPFGNNPPRSIVLTHVDASDDVLWKVTLLGAFANDFERCLSIVAFPVSGSLLQDSGGEEELAAAKAALEEPP